MRRIQPLTAQLANQIAAGEVVDRPASVVKELLENSVDAGATRIQIDIERGGTRLIRILDNGSGIHPDDMQLALSRHATSKIYQFDDFANLASLGFRGEALASIASVSKLLLRSRFSGEQQGWQAIAEGSDMQVELTPAVATEGTCVEVRDLFYNTPARRKFLRAETTEFAHIEDVVKRQALAAASVSVVLKHNGKVIKRYPAADQDAGFERKIAAACGQPFVKHSISVSAHHGPFKMTAWLGLPSYHRSESDTQLVFVNQRPVKDRMLSHALRQSYAERLPTGRFATYLVFIECPADQVDVNVHPTKHEVKFSQPRQLHDWLVKLVDQALTDASALDAANLSDFVVNSRDTQAASRRPELTDEANQSANRQSDAGVQGEHQEKTNPTRATGESPSFFDSPSAVTDKAAVAEQTLVYSDTADSKKDASQNTSPAPLLMESRWLIHHADQDAWLIDIWSMALHQLKLEWTTNKVISKPLLIPETLFIDAPDWLEQPEIYDYLQQAQLDLTPVSPTALRLRKLPRSLAPVTVDDWKTALEQVMSAEQAFTNSEQFKQVCIDQLRVQIPGDVQSLLNWSSMILSSNRPEEAARWQRFATQLDLKRVTKQLEQHIARAFISEDD